MGDNTYLKNKLAEARSLLSNAYIQKNANPDDFVINYSIASLTSHCRDLEKEIKEVIDLRKGSHSLSYTLSIIEE